MAEDGILQQETEGQNSPTSSIDGNRSQDEAQEQEPAERETQSQRLTESELRRKKWADRRAELISSNIDALAPEFRGSVERQFFYEAVRKGKLYAVEQLDRIKDPITLLRTRFTHFEANAFQVAVVAGQKEMFRKLMKKVNDIDHCICISMLKEKNTNGETILTLAVAQGSIEIVKELVDTCVELVDIPNKKGELPVTVAALLGEKEIVTFLFKLTMGLLDVEEDVVMTNSTQSSQGVGDFKVLKVSMTTQFSGHDERNYSFKLVSEDRDQAKPAYQSRHHCFRLFKACIRSKIYVCIEEMAKEDGKTMNSLVVETIKLQKQRNFVARFHESCLERWGGSCKLFSWFERCCEFLLVRTAKSWYENNYEQPKSAVWLVRWICGFMRMSETPDEDKIMQRVLTRAILTAVEQEDNTSFIDTIRFFYSEIPSDMAPSQDRFKMYISASKNPVTGLLGAIHDDRNGNTILHHAAMLSSAKKLSGFPSPSLQMQSEMQRFKVHLQLLVLLLPFLIVFSCWFKVLDSQKMEKIFPMCKGVENNNNLTPKDLFVEQHRELKSAGEKWLKETASSCSLLAMLIVTVMFSAAFTVPGGYENDTGRPVYLGSKYFTVFIISDALSLLFSSTSAMVFLGIYTSLFREEDFPKRLPLTLICGLFTLFLSITTMVIAFSAALILTLREHFVRITLPALMLASIPVIIYSVLNIPIFVTVLYSTLLSH